MGFFDAFHLASLGFFLIVVAQRTVALARMNKRSPIRIAPRRNDAQHGISLALFVGVNLWAAEILRRTLWPSARMWPHWVQARIVRSLGVQVLGAGTVLIGFVLFLLALRALGPSWRLGIDEQNPGQLVTDGIYAITRNPIHLFFFLYFFGTFMIAGTFIFALFALVLGTTLHLQTLAEERFLARVHAATYAQYARATPRYIRLSHLVRLVRAWPQDSVAASAIADKSAQSRDSAQ